MGCNMELDGDASEDLWTFEDTTNLPIKCKSKETFDSFDPPRRKSTRQRFKCGVCSSNGFVGPGNVGKEEMFMLRFQGLKRPTDIPECPVAIPEHLVCFRCLPRNKTSYAEIGAEVEYPPGSGIKRPILTKAAFFRKSKIPKNYYEKYAWVTGSDIDYTAKFVHQRGALLGQAGGEYDAKINEMIKIKSEM